MKYTEGESSVNFNSCNQWPNKTPIKNNRKKQINEDHLIKIHKNKNNSKHFNLIPIKTTPFGNGNSQKGSSKFKRGESSMSFNSCSQCLNLYVVKCKMKQQWKPNAIDDCNSQRGTVAEKTVGYARKGKVSLGNVEKKVWYMRLSVRNVRRREKGRFT